MFFVGLISYFGIKLTFVCACMFVALLVYEKCTQIFFCDELDISFSCFL
jgi:hypothetical protein